MYARRHKVDAGVCKQIKLPREDFLIVSHFFVSLGKPRKLRKLPQGIPQPSHLKSTQIYSKSVTSISPPKSFSESPRSFTYSTPQDSLINPQYNLIESQSFFTRREPVHISQTDIRTLFQVNRNIFHTI